MPNHLQNERSPYLLQHADNPVDWYPWGREALDKARAEDKPIFLSIGYAACHWCHVMAHESFEDEAVAAFLNEHFVSIKGDREERPDLDRIYMSAVQAMTGGGGWPMSVFLTPEGHPFYGGTYFPPAPRYGLPSFRQVLEAIADAWQHRRAELIQGGQRLVQAIERQGRIAPSAAGARLDRQAPRAAFRALQMNFDRTYGGWGGAPKFPQPMVLEFLLRYHRTTGEDDALAMATQTLEAMARGGMYDQIGGGFHRYSVDERWLVPHFEKMLYDNAQLARVYLHAWQATGHGFFRTIAEEILDYVSREMTDPAGGFYSTQDADSEGQEGKFFVWTEAEIRAALGDEADEFLAAYGVTAQGNWEGKNILAFVGDLDRRPALAASRRRLFEARRRRIPPGRDDKVLTAWNGLMLAAFAEAARALGREDYQQIARRNADFLLRELRRADGRLWRSWQAGQAGLNGYLEDYAALIEGLLELYQTTFEPHRFTAAQGLAETMLRRFWSPDIGFYDTSDDHETLITRPRDLQDNATPSGNALAAAVLLKLAGLAQEPRYTDLAHRLLAAVQPLMTQAPLGFGQWLQALAYTLARPWEIAIVGEPEAADTQALLRIVREGYRPFQVAALGAPDAQPPAVPLLRDRPLVGGRAAAYVCRDFTCQAPVTEPEELAALL
ncbi:MAG TPA: thioredoxin domain-containing protein [Anaerolineae bacterium]|nr:thioredoxin domain-containing protein [Anaerolineae bacterium]